MEGKLNSDHQRQGKKPRGRQKIEIKKVEKDSNRSVCFSHRKSGIFRKATEISSLCGAEIAVIIFSQKNKVFSYGDVDKLLDRYLGIGNNGSSLGSNKSQTTKTVQEQEYWKAVAMKEELKKELKIAESNRNLMKNNGEGFWWEADIEAMEKEELEGFKKSLEELKKNVLNRIQEISIPNSVSDASRMINECIMDGWRSYFFSSSDNGGRF